MKDFPAKTLFFGCGNMGGSILQGWLNANIPADNFHVIDPSNRPMPDGVTAYSTAKEFHGSASMLIIGVKPQMLSGLADEMKITIGPDTIIISILAGIELATLRGIFPKNQVVRMMPNLAATLGKSPIGLYGGDISDEQKQYLSKIVEPLGAAEWGQDDEFINIVTALAGSGPAYLYRFIDALASAAAKLGMPEEQALRLAKMMVDGASDLACASTDSPHELAVKVTSKGGTTAAGLEQLDRERALEHLIENTVRAARDRGVELSRA